MVDEADLATYPNYCRSCQETGRRAANHYKGPRIYECHQLRGEAGLPTVQEHTSRTHLHVYVLQLVTGLGLMRLTTAGAHAGEYLSKRIRTQKRE